MTVLSVVTIVGAGMMGSAMAFPAIDNGSKVRLVGTPLDRQIISHAKATGYHLTLKRNLPEQAVTYYQIEDLAQALAGADLVICGVSSFGFDWFIEEVIPHIPQTMPILSITKGLVNTPQGDLLSFPDYYHLRCPGLNHSFNAVGGPCISFELADRHHTKISFCGNDLPMLKAIKAMLQTPYYHIDLSTDVFGVECAVALKNAYALGVSLAIGLAQAQEGNEEIEHYNPQAALFGQSVKEISNILALYGGLPENIVLGAGDLYVTVFGGRTRKIGTLLGTGLTIDAALAKMEGVTLESLAITKRVTDAISQKIQQGAANYHDFALLMHIKDIIAGNTTVNIPWDDFATITTK